MDAVGADVSQRRTPYNHDSFTEDQLTSHTDPFVQFHAWFQEALKCIPEPQAMCVCTTTADGKPSSRMILMKKYDQSGFVFYTNYLSRKGKELGENPYACLLFYWEALHRQVRIEGKVVKLTEEESRAYFDSRPRLSQASACASMQSTVVSSKQELEDKQRAVLEKYPEGTPIPMPDYWGGYRVIPNYFEFWHGKSTRLHDRIVFSREEQTGKWQEMRLSS